MRLCTGRLLRSLDLLLSGECRLCLELLRFPLCLLRRRDLDLDLDSEDEADPELDLEDDDEDLDLDSIRAFPCLTEAFSPFLSTSLRLAGDSDFFEGEFFFSVGLCGEFFLGEVNCKP